uniref:Uncharacterized protein n=1 Tax=Romanomermis culicivorax TaxID=13658 RepID=A0A915KRG7_ROMCU
MSHGIFCLEGGDDFGDGGISGLCLFHFLMGSDCYGFNWRPRVIGGQRLIAKHWKCEFRCFSSLSHSRGL